MRHGTTRFQEIMYFAKSKEEGDSNNTDKLDNFELFLAFSVSIHENMCLHETKSWAIHGINPNAKYKLILLTA